MDARTFQLNVTASWLEEACPSSTVALLECDPEWNVVHANATALQLAHLTTGSPRSLADFIPAAEAREMVRALGEKATAMENPTGELQLQIGREGATIPARLSLAPVTSTPHGAGGFLLIIRSSHAERVSAKIDERTQHAQTAAEILTSVAEETKKAIPFDGFAATFYNKDLSHARVLLEYPEPFLTGGRRYFNIPAEHRTEASDLKLAHRELATLVDHSRSGEIPRLLKNGFRYLLRQPVESEGRLIGAVSLLTKNVDGFSPYEIELFRRLPLAKAMIASTLMLENEELRFRLKLLKKISTCRTDAELFSTLAEQLHRQYGWTHISVFTADQFEHRMVLQSQAGRSAIQNGYSQPEDTGILGYVFRTSEDVNSPNVRTDPKFKDMVHYVENPPHVVSELCMAIRSKEGLYALLDVEDNRENAFSPDEQEALRELLNDIGETMEARRKSNLAEAAVDLTPTAVFIVDSRGVIREANRAAHELLNVERHGLAGADIRTFVTGHVDGRPFLADSGSLPAGPLEITARDGQRLRVQVGGSDLGSTTDRRMIIFRDLSVPESRARLESASRIATDLAARVSTPLSIAGMQLEELRSLLPLERADLSRALLGLGSKVDRLNPDAIDRIYHQFLRIEQALGEWQCMDAVVVDQSTRPKRRTNVTCLLTEMLEEFSESDRSRIQLSISPEDLVIELDAFALVFAMQSIIAYLLRIAPREQKVAVSLGLKPAALRIIFQAPVSSAPGLGAGELSRTRSREQVAKAESFIMRFAENSGGTYHRTETRDDISIELNLAREERV